MERIFRSANECSERNYNKCWWCQLDWTLISRFVSQLAWHRYQLRRYIDRWRGVDLPKSPWRPHQTSFTWRLLFLRNYGLLIDRLQHLFDTIFHWNTRPSLSDYQRWQIDFCFVRWCCQSALIDLHSFDTPDESNTCLWLRWLVHRHFSSPARLNINLAKFYHRNYCKHKKQMG